MYARTARRRSNNNNNNSTALHTWSGERRQRLTRRAWTKTWTCAVRWTWHETTSSNQIRNPIALLMCLGERRRRQTRQAWTKKWTCAAPWTWLETTPSNHKDQTLRQQGSRRQGLRYYVEWSIVLEITSPCGCSSA